MKSIVLKRVNLTMVIKWIVFMPVILPLCVVFGALKGITSMVDKMAQQMMADIES